MATSALAPEGVVFDADHPFLYLIRDLTTGQLLFAGQQTSGS
jgi:serine protease inhibitor